MFPTSSTDSHPFVAGPGFGAMGYILGYVVTYLLVATDIESSPLNHLLEFFEGDSTTYKLVGYVFYKAYLVDIFYTGVGVFSPSRSFIGSEDGFTVLLYLTLPALLVDHRTRCRLLSGRR